MSEPRNLLDGLGVVVTRPESPTGPLHTMLAGRGARVLHWPAVRIVEPLDPAPLLAAAQRLHRYDWLVFSSARAVEALSAVHPGALRGPRVAVVGPSTAESVMAAGWTAEQIAEPARGSALVDAFSRRDCRGRRMLFVAGDIARPTIPDGLRKLGAELETVVAYRTIPADLDRERCARGLETDSLAAVTYASPSAVGGLRSGLGESIFRRLAERVPAVVIGPTTADALREHGGSVAAVAEPSTLAGLVAGIESIVLARSR